MASTLGQMSREYRSNVAGILESGGGKIFVARRLGIADAWQFPQGGVDKGESIEEAFAREMEEEIGLPADAYDVLEQRDGYRYEFPSGHKKWGRFSGQEQTYFRCRMLVDDTAIDIATEHPEFDQWQWISPAEFRIDWVPDFKKAVYQQVFADFFDVDL